MIKHEKEAVSYEKELSMYDSVGIPLLDGDPGVDPDSGMVQGD
jgi:hypothetical protein